MRRESSLDTCLLTMAQHSTLDGLGFDPLWMFKRARLGNSKVGSIVHTDPRGRAHHGFTCYAGFALGNMRAVGTLARQRAGACEAKHTKCRQK